MRCVSITLTTVASIIAIFNPLAKAEKYDVLIKNGTLYDGTGNAPIKADVAISDGLIAAIGDLNKDKGKTTINAEGLAVAPGFINMLSHAPDSLIVDSRGMSDIEQGVTLEVFGEYSQGPITAKYRAADEASQTDFKYKIEWTTLGEFMDYLVKRGTAPNIASFVGASTIRVYVLGLENRDPTPDELDAMREHVRRSMKDGAMGVTSALIYPPASYASTRELIELCKVASEYGGMYIVHMRSEGNKLLEAIDETIKIARDANLPAEIYHLKMAGRNNWDKLDDVIAKVEQAQKEGLRITADMYNYTAGATGLDSCVPPWVREGGRAKLIERLQDPEIRARVAAEMKQDSDEWENLYYAAGSPENLIPLEFKTDALKKYTGKSIAQIANLRETTPEATVMDLLVEDGTRITTVYFLMAEENVKRQIALPWVSFGSDAGAPAAEGLFLNSSVHPRAYGNFSRLLGKYVREEKVISLEEAVRKLTSLPASNLGVKDRGLLKIGYHADIAIFDPDTIGDHATFADPHQYSVGMEHVFVNGVQVLKKGKHTGAVPGQIVHGPGWIGREN